MCHLHPACDALLVYSSFRLFGFLLRWPFLSLQPLTQVWPQLSTITRWLYWRATGAHTRVTYFPLWHLQPVPAAPALCTWNTCRQWTVSLHRSYQWTRRTISKVCWKKYWLGIKIHLLTFKHVLKCSDDSPKLIQVLCVRLKVAHLLHSLYFTYKLSVLHVDAPMKNMSLLNT